MLTVRQLDASEFVTQVLPKLAEREAENNLMIGHAKRVANDTHDPNAVFAVVESDGELVGAAMREPPRLPIVSRLPAGAARVVAELFAKLGDLPDGAIGPGEHGRELALALAEQRGGHAELTSDEVVYELTAVLPLVEPPGFARLATTADLGLVTHYFAQFFREVVLPHAPDPAPMAAVGIERSAVLLWDDGGVRSMACRARRTLTGAAIAPVYTPSGARGRGYGTAVTAELCRGLLATGSRFVCLHADRANKTSNHIYQAIGFRAVSTLSVWTVS